MLEPPPPPTPPPPTRAMGGEGYEEEADTKSTLSSSSIALDAIVTVGFGSVHDVPPIGTDSESPMEETTTSPPPAAPHSPSCLTLTPTVWALHRFEWVLPSQSHTGM